MSTQKDDLGQMFARGDNPSKVQHVYSQRKGKRYPFVNLIYLDYPRNCKGL